ncbi:hypothetical protein ACHHYP_20819 [Achlya hypogyna]|uniref:Uncharacterized protein n=1 Tax=Achlya hypogyna TaxID=1202772 RepID=A0A1V9Y6Y9_ACHHY|nr:hypothetical protein ACHHYP_20819 [Achlya hypogyna]
MLTQLHAFLDSPTGRQLVSTDGAMYFKAVSATAFYLMAPTSCGDAITTA